MNWLMLVLDLPADEADEILRLLRTEHSFARDPIGRYDLARPDGASVIARPRYHPDDSPDGVYCRACNEFYVQPCTLHTEPEQFCHCGERVRILWSGPLGSPHSRAVELVCRYYPEPRCDWRQVLPESAP